jgi:UDP-N-acetylmuramoylalanine--D-glutamate ligase
MNIAIWGMGVSGKATLEYAKSLDHDIYCISQGDPSQWSAELGLDQSYCFDQMDVPASLELDLIILSPGIDPRIKPLIRFQSVPKICKVEWTFQQMEKIPPIIAITGTNGKTTTCSLVALALQQLNKRVFLGGNIGRPFCEVLQSKNEYDFIVLELSSFQLELIDKFRAQVACILNIEPNHMERYDSFEQYRSAKLNILRNGCELFLACEDFKFQDKFEPIKPIDAIDWSRSQLRGKHYRENFYVVEKALGHFGLKSNLQLLAESFAGVSFRLQFIGKKNEVSFYNDAKSTNTASTLAAVQSFKDDRITLILGGQRRGSGQDWSALIGFKCIGQIIALGDASLEIKSSLEEFYRVEVIESLDQLSWGLINTKVVVFSPGYPSFDQYKNYMARGADFNRIVEDLL